MTWVKGWDVPSSSGRGVYRVSVDENGEWGCSCPVWTLQGRKECKHIKAIRATQAQPTPVALKRVLDFAEALKKGKGSF